ncbi:MAG: alpha/beta hydrolase [Phyllobacteriaceae bacterium]|jgi:pimeloyl-ACP methyl ester carboxylesterase|nr:alpha/beta hydrolase [Phyllobacteriaceae bacterium]
MHHSDFSARQRHVTLNGIAHVPVRIAYTDLGKGPPLILMHGIPTWSYLYHEVIDRLAETNRVIAPDFIGHGNSDKRDLLDRSLVAQRAMILSLMDALGLDRATLIGHDTGGGVALIMAVENAERVDRLVLSNIVAYDSWPIDDMISLGHPAWAKKSNDETREFLVGGFKDGLSRKDRMTAEFVDGIVAPYVTDEGRISLIRNASGLNTSHTTMLMDRHKDIAAETLLVWGVDDPWQPIADGERLAQDIPDASLVSVENASHWIPQDAPQEWLASVQPFVSELG